MCIDSQFNRAPHQLLPLPPTLLGWLFLPPRSSCLSDNDIGNHCEPDQLKSHRRNKEADHQAQTANMSDCWDVRSHPSRSANEHGSSERSGTSLIEVTVV